MNSLQMRGILADLVLDNPEPEEDYVRLARDAIDGLLARAYEDGDVVAVRTLHAVTKMLTVARH